MLVATTREYTIRSSSDPYTSRAYQGLWKSSILLFPIKGMMKGASPFEPSQVCKTIHSIANINASSTPTASAPGSVTTFSVSDFTLKRRGRSPTEYETETSVASRRASGCGAPEPAGFGAFAPLGSLSLGFRV